MVKVGGEGRERMMMPAGGAAASYCPALLCGGQVGEGVGDKRQRGGEGGCGGGEGTDVGM